jgi:hypothetical protein
VNDDVPKLPTQQPQYVVERSIVNASPVPNKEKNPFNEPAQQADNFGGLFVTASGTENYLVSPSAPPDEYVYIISPHVRRRADRRKAQTTRSPFRPPSPDRLHTARQRR